MAEYLTDFATDTGSNHTGVPAAAAAAAQACGGVRLPRLFDPRRHMFRALGAHEQLDFVRACSLNA